MTFLQGIRTRYLINCMEYHVISLLFLGIWPLVKIEKNRYLRWARVLPHVCFSLCLIYVLIIFYELPGKLYQYELLSETIMVFVLVVKTLIRLYLGVFKVYLMVDVINRIQGLAENWITNRSERKIYKLYRSWAFRFSALFVSVCLCNGVFFLLEPLTDEVRRFPGHMNPPIPNAFVSPTYEIIYVYSVMLGLFVVGVSSCGSSAVVALLIYVTGHFKILQYKLEHTRKYAKRKVVNCLECGPMPMYEEVSETISRVGIEGRIRPEVLGCRDRLEYKMAPNVLSIGLETRGEVMGRRCKVTILTPRHLSRDLTFKAALPREDDIDVEMDRHLGKCLEYHCDIMGVFGELQDLVNYLTFFETCVGAVQIGICLYQVAMSTPFSYRMVMWLGLLFVQVLELFSFCWAVSSLAEESVKVCDSVYFSDWVQASRSYRRSIQIMMSRAVNPVNLTLASFLQLNMETFMNVCNSSYSYFNIGMTMSSKTNLSHMKQQ